MIQDKVVAKLTLWMATNSSRRVKWTRSTLLSPRPTRTSGSSDSLSTGGTSGFWASPDCPRLANRSPGRHFRTRAQSVLRQTEVFATTGEGTKSGSNANMTESNSTKTTAQEMVENYFNLTKIRCIQCTFITYLKDASHSCHPDAECSSTFNSFICSCKAGFAGDGMAGAGHSGCTEITLVDECATGEHNCHPDARCRDTQLSFVCSCKDGMIDTSPLGDGSSCTPTPPCCKSFTIGIENPTSSGTTLPK